MSPKVRNTIKTRWSWSRRMWSLKIYLGTSCYMKLRSNKSNKEFFNLEARSNWLGLHRILLRSGWTNNETTIMTCKKSGEVQIIKIQTVHFQELLSWEAPWVLLHKWNILGLGHLIKIMYSWIWKTGQIWIDCRLYTLMLCKEKMFISLTILRKWLPLLQIKIYRKETTSPAPRGLQIMSIVMEFQMMKNYKMNNKQGT